MKHFWLATVLFFGVSGTLFAYQTDERVFDLLSRLRLTHSDTGKMDIYLALSDHYLLQNPTKAENNARLALILAENNGDHHRHFEALNNLIIVARDNRNDLSKAHELLQIALQLPQETLPLADLILLREQVGRTALALDQHEEAQRAFLEQLNLAESTGDAYGTGRAHYYLGKLYRSRNEPERALDHLESALERFAVAKADFERIKTLNDLGMTYGRLKDYQRNLTYCSRALDGARQLGNTVLTTDIHRNIGFAYEHLGKTTDALRHYTMAMESAEETDDPAVLAGSGVALGDIELERCREPEARTYFGRALAAAEAADRKALLRDAYDGMYRFYDQTGQPDSAFLYLQKLTAVKDALYNEEQARQMVRNQIKYESERKEAENKRLRALELENKITIQNQRLQVYGLVVIVLLVLGSIYFLFREIRTKRAANQELEEEVNRRTVALEEKNAELSTANEQLEQSNHELERFAYIASHDLKSPLRNVISFLNLIERKLRKYPEDKDLKEYLRFAGDSARQMHQLIQDVLEFSRAGSDDEPLEDVDLNESLHLVMRNLQKEMQQRDAGVFVEQLPMVRANNVQMLQLFQNLIGNGIKYNQSNRARVLVRHRAEAERHVFSVQDNGIGIGEEFHRQIFSMFKRLHTKEEYAGTGIGLALCKKIVDRLGGEIWLESESGRGTTFYFSIPFSAN